MHTRWHSSGPRHQGGQTPAGRRGCPCPAGPRCQPVYPFDDAGRPGPGFFQRRQPDRRFRDRPDADCVLSHPGGEPAGPAIPPGAADGVAGAIRAHRHSAGDRRRTGHPRPHPAVDPGLRHVHHRGVPGPALALARPPAQAQAPVRADQELSAAANHGKPAVRFPVGGLDAAVAVADLWLAVRRKPVRPAPGAQDPAGVPGLGGVQRAAVGP
ncbi:hypothetical protein BHE74_00044330 [Ensete ventricosum]|nr:hypothetical protein BHE74_00044330 [Ensete ventricosum]